MLLTPRAWLSDSHLVRLELPSSFELLDLVQLLSDRLSAIAGLDEDAMHWVSVAVRESVINAIKHGNREDRTKHVTVEFMLDAARRARGVRRRGARRGRGLRSRGRRQPARPRERPEVERPRHLLHAQLHGRRVDRPAARRRHGRAHEQEAGLIGLSIPLYLATAVEARARARPHPPPVLPAGRPRSRRRARSISSPPPTSRPSRRSARSSRDGFPSHAVLGEEAGAGRPHARGARCRGSSTRSTARRTSRTASRCSACRSRSRSTGVSRSASSTTRSAEELFTAERGQGARLNGQPIRVSARADARRRAAVHRVSVHRPRRRRGARWRCSRRSSAQARAVRRLGSAALDLCYVAAGRFDGFWEEQLHPWDMAAGALIVEEAAAASRGYDDEPLDLVRRPHRRVERPRARARCWTSSATRSARRRLARRCTRRVTARARSRATASTAAGRVAWHRFCSVVQVRQFLDRISGDVHDPHIGSNESSVAVSALLVAATGVRADRPVGATSASADCSSRAGTTAASPATCWSRTSRSRMCRLSGHHGVARVRRARRTSGDGLTSIEQFRGWSLFGEWNIGFGDRVELGIGASYYSKKVDSRYRDLEHGERPASPTSSRKSACA